MTTTAEEAPPIQADLAAWLAVAAGLLGALMATLDITIINSALPTIQGEIGANGAEGTWVATAYLVAEIIVIPLSGWLVGVFGLRNFLLGAAVLFTAFSVLCGTADSLDMMIIGRAGQGFTGGAMIPTAMTIIATRLPRSKQAVGTALFGIVGVLAPVAGPVVGGWLTDNLSWRYAFLINVPVCLALVLLLLIGLPHRRMELGKLGQADWLGITGMTLWLGAMTVVLEEGHRELWFESSHIVALTMLSAVGFALLMIGQITNPAPVIRLSLLKDNQFRSVVIMAVALGIVLYATNYLVPQFVATVAGYSALQAGQVLMLSALPVMLMVPFIPVMSRKLDIRLAVGAGIFMLAGSCFLETTLTDMSGGGDFAASQLMRGTGMILVFVFLNQAAISAVPVAFAADASGLYNAARNFGGSIALAGMATMQDDRLAFHSRRLEETLSQGSETVDAYLSSLGEVVGDPAALRALAGTIHQQALVMTYNDLFLVTGICVALAAPLAFFLRPLPQGAAAAMH